MRNLSEQSVDGWLGIILQEAVQTRRLEAIGLCVRETIKGEPTGLLGDADSDETTLRIRHGENIFDEFTARLLVLLVPYGRSFVIEMILNG